MREWGEESYDFWLAKEKEKKEGVPFLNACCNIKMEIDDKTKLWIRTTVEFLDQQKKRKTDKVALISVFAAQL